MNNALYKNGMERINNDALATLTILVASSRPEDKEIMMQLIKTIIKYKRTIQLNSSYYVSLNLLLEKQ